MNYILLLTTLLTVNCYAKKCEIKRQHNESTNKYEKIQICWDDTAEDWAIGGTVVETLISVEDNDHAITTMQPLPIIEAKL